MGRLGLASKEMLVVTAEELIALAQEARQRAYVPYSHFAVGAALLGRSGKVYTACNVENVSYGLSICAEGSGVQGRFGRGAGV